MSEATAAEAPKRSRNDEPIDFELVERQAVPKRSFPRASKWLKVIEAAVENEGKFVLVRKIGDRTERSVMAALTGFAKRHQGLLKGKKLRTQTHAEGGVLVWATTPQDQTELPLEKPETAAA